jgi:hypothetical protein
MIVFKNNKGFEQRLDKPNENWTNEPNVFIIDDNSELANKIIKAYPYYNFIENEKGELIDIEVLEKPVVVPKPTLEQEVEELKQLMADLVSIQLGV